jgi:hypothetical protein
MNANTKQATLDAYHWLLTDQKERVGELIQQSEFYADIPTPEEEKENVPRCWRQFDLLSRSLRIEWFQDAPKWRRCIKWQGVDCDRLASLLLGQDAPPLEQTKPHTTLRVVKFPT